MKKIKCLVCDAEEFIGGEVDERTLEDDGWYIGENIAYCPDHCGSDE